jgi:hypothetical protein
VIEMTSKSVAYYVGHCAPLGVEVTYRRLHKKESVCLVDIGKWKPSTEGARPWHDRKIALKIARQILLHHCSRLRGRAYVNPAVAYWHEQFADQVLARVTTIVVDLSDQFINEWLVGCILDEFIAQTASLRRMRSAGLSLN